MRRFAVSVLAFATLLACASPLPHSDPTVYKTRTGTKYHREWCRYLSKSKIAIKLTAAKKEGLGPCSVCEPPRWTNPR